MSEYSVEISEEVRNFLDSLDEKSRRICVENLKKLIEDPYPGTGKGDKKKETIRREEIFRIHIGRTYTAFYIIIEDQKLVRIIEIDTIDSAHKKYGA
ncbi:plasmid stabilization protein [candidate division MSBL1 archaeon SCGC-AAA259E17]|uniref:Plasmid stabilization protein n=1 Tax=candidate division MSBL1 archaeon SCGC-AAA259E17 TaxID=1698263 RepID=A0A133UED1_9EURY|nr:plasmid stabilization protein [candidate division MSBL1 archaeon SCGC-AAA259E17]